MSGGRFIKEAMIAAICEHPNQDDYSKKAFNVDNLPSSVGVDSLCKADFMTPDAKGVYIIDTPGFWKNLDKVLSILEKNGETFSYDDFMRPLKQGDDRNLLESAIEYDGLKKLFTFDVWKGRFDDMDLLWYHVPVPLRKELFKNDGLIDLNLKRRLLQFEGQEAPEDGLRRSGLSMKDIFNAFSGSGEGYNNVKRQLSENGDYLRKSYLLLTDTDGDTLFHQETAWKKYTEIATDLSQHGERLEAADFLRNVGTRQNILDRGAHHSQLHKIFTPELWVDHLSEMVDLWKYIKPGWKVGDLTTEKFDGYYAEAEDLSYAAMACFDNIQTKADLFTRLSPDEDGVAKVIPLGLKSFWDHVETIETQLKEKGEKIELSDLRHISGELGNSCLMTAVKCGQFDKIVTFVKSSGDKLTLDDFLVKDRHGNSMLNILAEQRELSKVFTPDMWIGRVTEMKTLWTHVRLDDRKQLDFMEIEVATKQATLKSKSNRKGKFKL